MDVVEPIGSRRTFEPLAGGGYAYTAIDEGIRIELRQLHQDHHQLYGEVDVKCNWAGVRTTADRTVSCAHQNVSSQPARSALARYCEKRTRTKPEEFDWQHLVDDACQRAIQAERAGDDVIVLDDADDVPPRDYDVCGLKVPADARSMLIAHGDSMKSLLLLLVLGTLAQRGVSVLYLDWEWTAARHKARKRRLFGTDRLAHLHYLRCRAPLTVEAPRIRRFCDEHDVQLIGGDSVALACDGSLKRDDILARFNHSEDRLLGVSLPERCN